MKSTVLLGRALTILTERSHLPFCQYRQFDVPRMRVRARFSGERAKLRARGRPPNREWPRQTQSGDSSGPKADEGRRVVDLKRFRGSEVAEKRGKKSE